MKKMSWMKAAITAAVLAMCLSGTAYAAPDRDGTITLSPLIGGYVFEGNQHLDNGPVYGFAAGYNFGKNWGGEFSFHAIDSHSSTGSSDADGYLLQIGGLYHFRPESKLQPYLQAGSGAIIIDKDRTDTRTRFMASVGGGVEYFITDNLALRADMRYIQVFGTTNSNFMYTAGVTWFLGKTRKIYDDLVGTRKAAPPAPVEEAKAPVPPPPAPAPAPAPVEPPAAPREEVQAPAPPPAPMAPPAAPAPEAPAAKKGETCISLRVEFDFNKSDIKPEYHAWLKKAADFFKEHPNAHGTVAGYTDAVGSSDYNMKLGMRRAEAVKKYLVDNYKIAPERLKTKSLGKSSPVSTNKTKAGRSRNRRAVEVFCTTE